MKILGWCLLSIGAGGIAFSFFVATIALYIENKKEFWMRATGVLIAAVLVVFAIAGIHLVFGPP